MWSGIGKAVVEGTKGSAKAVNRTVDELRHNEALHKGLEFGGRAAWEVTKDVAKRAGQDAVEAWAEQKIVGGLGRIGTVGEIAQSVLDNPGVVSVRHSREIAKKIQKGLREYPGMARDLGERIRTVK